MEISDTEDIIRWRNQEEVRRYFINQELFTRQGHLEWFNNVVAAGKAVQFIITDKRNERPLGSVYLRDIDYKNSKCEFGIFIGESDYRGHGVGTEAANLIIKYAFEELKLNKIFLRVLADNIRAITSYQKAGFTTEGCFKKDVCINNKFMDIVFMAILRDDR
jgi:diamine N-acetyltransferase